MADEQTTGLQATPEAAEPRRTAVVLEDEDRLECPHCQARGLDNFIYVETVSNMRKLKSLEDGLLMIESHYDVADEGGDDPRLACMTCDHDLEIPADLELDWE